MLAALQTLNPFVAPAVRPADVKMYWHPQGDYFAVKVERFTKTKKSTFTGFELFSIRDKDIPMEVLELPNKSEKVRCARHCGRRCGRKRGSGTLMATRAWPWLLVEGLSQAWKLHCM